MPDAPFQGGIKGTGKNRRHQAFGGFEVPKDGADLGLWATGGERGFVLGRSAVEAFDDLRQTTHVRRGDLAMIEQDAEEAIFREAPHVDGVIHHDGARGRDEGPLPAGAGILVERDDSQVDIGTKPPVEPDLVQAELVSKLRGGEVDERKPNRLLQLVDIVPRQADHREMGLPDFDMVRQTRKAIRFVKALEEGGGHVWGIGYWLLVIGSLITDN